jgi:hypothetical protein
MTIKMVLFPWKRWIYSNYGKCDACERKEINQLDQTACGVGAYWGSAGTTGIVYSQGCQAHTIISATRVMMPATFGFL